MPKDHLDPMDPRAVGPIAARAFRFAAAAHAAAGQLRKYTGRPYIEHPLAVAQLVRHVTDDEATIAAAFLHDTVEDTAVTLDEIEMGFGAPIARLVSDLTDVSTPRDGNRRLRKELDRAHIARADPRAQTVKLADLIDNTRSIVAHDRPFALVYLAEKERLLEVLGGGHRRLYLLALKTLENAKLQLAEHEKKTALS